MAYDYDICTCGEVPCVCRDYNTIPLDKLETDLKTNPETGNEDWRSLLDEANSE